MYHIEGIGRTLGITKQIVIEIQIFLPECQDDHEPEPDTGTVNEPKHDKSKRKSSYWTPQSKCI
jgi:hypothetical protein